MARTILRWLPVLLFACAAVGCQVPRVPEWLPDSSGFLFTNEQGGVDRFDVASGKTETVLKEGSTRTRILAVDPAGKRFALVRAMPEEGADLVQVLLYGMDGKELQKSEPAKWTAPNEPPIGDKPWESGGIWSPKGKHLIVWHLGSKGELLYGQYDADANQLKRLEGITPLVHALAVGMSPISDDDRGFLAGADKPKPEAKEQPAAQEKAEPKPEPKPADEAEVYFVEWDGRRRMTRSIAPEAKAFFEELEKSVKKPGSDEPAPLSETLLAPFPTGRWEQGVAVIENAGGQLRIDTAKDSVEYRTDEKMKERRQKMLADGILYRVPIGRGPWAVQCRKGLADGDKETIHVEIAGPEADNTTRLGTLEVSTGLLALGHVPRVAIPSPDGKSVIVTYRAEGAMYAAVVNAEGRVLGKTPIAWPGQ